MDSEKIVVRHLTRRDLSEIVEIEKLSARGGVETGLKEETIDLPTARRFLDNWDSDASFGAEINGKLVGYILGEKRAWEFGDYAEPVGWLKIIGVNPDYRRLKIGEKLAKRLFEHFRECGIKQVKTLIAYDWIVMLSFVLNLGLEKDKTIVMTMNLE